MDIRIAATLQDEPNVRRSIVNRHILGMIKSPSTQSRRESSSPNSWDLRRDFHVELTPAIPHKLRYDLFFRGSAGCDGLACSKIGACICAHCSKPCYLIGFKATIELSCFLADCSPVLKSSVPRFFSFATAD